MKTYNISIQETGTKGQVAVSVTVYETITVPAGNAEEVLARIVSAVAAPATSDGGTA